MRNYNINSLVFFAPWHTFDKKSITELKEELSDRCILQGG